MRKALLPIGCVILLSMQAHAATVSKCVDASGRVHYMQNQDCPPGYSVAGDVTVKSERPSGDGKSVLIGDPSKNAPPKPRRQVVAYEPAEEVAEPEAAPEPRVVVAPRANQPCVRFVEKLVTRSEKTQDGKIRSRASMVKVPVPC